MDDIERRLAGALKARADEVTEDSLSDLDLGTRTHPRRRRWLVVAAVAGVAAALVIGLTLIPGVFHSAAPDNLSPAIPCDSVCHVFQRLTVDGDSVEVWAGARSGDWEVQVSGVPIATFTGGGDIELTNPVTCWEEPAPARCVVRASSGGGSRTSLVGMIKELSGGWRLSGVTFELGEVDSFDLKDLGLASGPILIFVERGGSGNLWTLDVWEWNGAHLGCIPYVDAKEKLPGWPNDMRPRQMDGLVSCGT